MFKPLVVFTPLIPPSLTLVQIDHEKVILEKEFDKKSLIQETLSNDEESAILQDCISSFIVQNTNSNSWIALTRIEKAANL